MKYKLPALGYGYDELERSISEEVMTLHHQKHHQGYVDKLNAALEGVDVGSGEVMSLLSKIDDLPKDKRLAVRNNGGGHLNHSLFWRVMSPRGGGQPSGELSRRLNARYGSFQQFVDEFSAQATGLFGSGWVWLMPDLDIKTTANQDNPVMFGESMPILGLDVWEHAYYLDYKNQRDRYISAWWDVVDWSEVQKGQSI